MAIQLNHHHLYQLSSSTHENHLNIKLKSSITTSKPKTFKIINNAISNMNGKQLVQTGKVKAILAKDAAMAMNSEGFLVLDIRPEWERKKAHVKGSIHVPLFVKDVDNSIVTLLKKWVHFGYIGLWTGQNFTMFNPSFLQQVEASVVDKDAKLLVACGEGLRSLMAVSRLYEGGYKKLGWLAGGFNKVVEGDFLDVEGNEKLQYATIGGVSYYFLQLLLLLKAID